MTTLILVIHVMIAIALVGVVLLQRSEGGALGIGGGGGGGGLMSGRGAASLLTRATAILAASFMATSIILAILAGGGGQRSVLDATPVDERAPAGPAIPGAAPVDVEPAPAAPAGPAVPAGD